jgi:glycosyltransferase involved in cell wall biosynthesis
VPAGDPVALGDAIRRLSQSTVLREQLGRNGRRRVERDYEVGQCSERFHRLLTKVYA